MRQNPILLHTINALLFAWVRISHTNQLENDTLLSRPHVKRKINKKKHTRYVSRDVASFTGTTRLSCDAPKPLAYSLSISLDAAKWWCISEATGLFFLLKSWGVKTGMSWLDTLFNLSLAPQEASSLLTVSLFFFTTLALPSSSFSNSREGSRIFGPSSLRTTIVYSYCPLVREHV